MSDAECSATWARLQAIDDDILRPDYPPELVDAELREHGIDPEGRRGVEFVEGLKMERR